ncbi:MAG: glycosyl hydrolase [Kiritimatiellae bacterium]|nr:glycosyl hydrolase [Kiritimatiellia bacterium]MDD5522484.1 glycosyl hydrolase [Kiritimatiellia bacterium]
MNRRDFIRTLAISSASLISAGFTGCQKLGITTESKKYISGKFEFDLFNNPDSFYRPAYFWCWNYSITREIISKQLADMNVHGARSVCLHPLPKAFRPNTMFTLMEPDYMTPAYLDMYRYAVEQCQKLNMKMYLYDEGGWPSGACLGQVVEQNPELIYKQLARQLLTPKKGSTFSIPDSCLSAFLYQGDAKIRQLAPGTTGTINIDNARIMLFDVKKGNTWWPYQYPDLLNPKSTQEFLRLTHEKYKNTVGAYFGNTIKITFTDEAQAANPGWTDDIVTDFRDKYGYDLRNELPSIFEGDSEHDRKVRIDYFNWWSQRNADAYYGQIQEWCHRNNLLSSGHLNGEDATVFARKYGYGHPLRCLRRMDVPGVDVIWRQLWPGGNNHHFPKYASTVAHQGGKPWVLSESCAVYGSGLTPEQMKWVSDYQYVRGVNLLVISNYPQSTRDYFLGGCRPLFGPGHPFWRYLGHYHDYIGRLSYLLSLGSPCIKTALYYPIKDIWAGGSELDAVCSSNDELARVLLENQCDFDFIDDDVLENNSTKIVEQHLEVGPMRYDLVCVSRNAYMSDKSISKLEQFINAGGKVLWVDSAVGGQKPRGITKTTVSQLPSLLTPTVALKSPNTNIRVCKRVLANGAVYFVTNEDARETSCTMQFNESRPIVQFDPETGKCWVPSRALKTSKGWEISIDLKFAGSCVFIFTDDFLSPTPEPAIPARVLQTISDGWSCRKTTGFMIGDHDMEVHDLPREQLVNITLGDWRQVIGNIYSGDVEYIVKFNCTTDAAKNARVLNLGDVRYVCQAWLNEEPLGKKLWQPFLYDIRGKIRNGNNILKVIVTNTLANQYTNTKALEKWPAKKLGPYHSRTLGFEKDTVASGLFGPVTIEY